MDGSLIVSETLGDMSAGFFALVSVLILVIGVLYIGKAIWIIFGRRKR